MSARARLLADLSAQLGPAFVVSARAAVPDQVDPDRYAVRAFTGRIVPGPTVRALEWQLTVWLLTGRADPTDADTHLDDGLHDVLDVLLGLPWVRFDEAQRDVMEDVNGPRYHGYRFTLTAHAEITED